MTDSIQKLRQFPRKITHQIKSGIMTGTKKLVNKAGYDIKLYRPHYETVLRKYAVQTVFDIGANNGQFAKDIHKRLPSAQIYSFEPLKVPYRDLVDSMVHVRNFKAYNIALGDTTGEVEMHRSSFTPSSSLLPMTDLHKKLYPKSALLSTETIRIEKLDDIAKNISIKKPLMVKMDVQGFEDKVIAGGLDTLAHAAVVLVETSFKELYEGQPLFKDIHDKLAALGFSYFGNNGQHFDPQTGDLIYEDSIFVR
jgi:FkbM family methyltransferase